MGSGLSYVGRIELNELGTMIQQATQVAFRPHLRIEQKRRIITMNILIRTILVTVLLSITSSASAGESDETTSHGVKPLPQPNWSVLTGKPLKSAEEGGKKVDIFPAQTKRTKALDYAWATGASIDETCMLIIWIRGTREDKRIVYEAKKENNMCTVYFSKADFEQQFKYCVLSGINSKSDKGFVASFGGGPSGDRDDYWFEWGDPSYVKPDFYCILK